MLRRLLDSPWTYFALAALLLVGTLVSRVEIRIPSRPMGTIEDLRELRDRDDLNLLFVVIDTLRSDRLSAYGYHRPTSPVMADVSSAGIRFAHVEAQSTWTKCSMASLWTGMLPTRTGITRFHDAIPDDAVMPAEILREAGFRTAGVWRNGWVATNFGFGQGFETYFRPNPNKVKRDIKKRRPGQAVIGTDEDLTYAAIEFLRNHGHERFMLYLHYMDVHQYAFDQASAELGFGASYSDHYDSAIHWVDRNVGEVLLALEDSGLFEETLVVITADHGESFYEHGAEGHARSLYREVTEVPLLIIPPFRLEEELVVEPVVSNVDVWPTILDLLGLPPLPNTDGRSLVPLIQAAANGEPPPAQDPRPAFAYLDTNWGQFELESDPLFSVRRDGKRLLIRPERENGPTELYDHDGDPTEQTNLAGSAPEIVSELREVAEAELAKPRAWGDVPQVEVDEFYKEQLRALGYVIKDDGELGREKR